MITGTPMRAKQVTEDFIVAKKKFDAAILDMFGSKGVNPNYESLYHTLFGELCKEYVRFDSIWCKSGYFGPGPKSVKIQLVRFIMDLEGVGLMDSVDKFKNMFGY